MNKTALCVLGLFLFGSAAFGEDRDPLAAAHRSLKDETFVVETDDTSVSDSLNRISGNIDLGFSAPEQSYDSTDHYRPGPFGRADQQDQSQRY